MSLDLTCASQALIGICLFEYMGERTHLLINNDNLDYNLENNMDSNRLYSQISEAPRKFSYLFAGKVALFPLIILFLMAGATALLLYGEKKYSGGYFESNEFYYGLVGLFLFVACLILFVLIMFWLVVKISFEITPTKIRVLKRGVFRKSILEFKLRESSVHYFRTHFSEEQCWLQLVFREGTTFYSIFSWKGRGSQQENFHQLFKSLNNAISSFQKDIPKSPTAHSLALGFKTLPTEILSKDEFTIIGPFTQKLKMYAFRQRSSQNRRSDIDQQKDDLERSRPLCAEEIPMVNFDSFFRHFKHSKHVEDEDEDEDENKHVLEIGNFV